MRPCKRLGGYLAVIVFFFCLAWLIIGSIMLVENNAIEDYPEMFCRRWSIKDIQLSNDGRIATVSTCAGLFNICLVDVIVHVPGTHHPLLIFGSNSVREYMEENSIERANETSINIRCSVECKKGCFTVAGEIWATTRVVNPDLYATMVSICIIIIGCVITRLCTNLIDDQDGSCRYC